MKRHLIILATLLFALPASAQNNVAIKTNLLYGATSFTPNLSIEVGLGKQTTIDLAVGYNWFNVDYCSTSKNNNKKLAHWIVQPEARYYLCERFNGHFFGVHPTYSEYNIGGYNLPMFFGKGSQDFRHQGYAFGVGVSYGYQLMLGRKWNLEFNIGAGYMQFEYDKFDRVACGKQIEANATNSYFGITKAGITIAFML